MQFHPVLKAIISIILMPVKLKEVGDNVAILSVFEGIICKIIMMDILFGYGVRSSKWMGKLSTYCYSLICFYLEQTRLVWLAGRYSSG